MSGVPGDHEILVVTPGFRGGSWVMLQRAIAGAPAVRLDPPRRATAIGAGPGPPEDTDGVRIERMPWPEYDRVAHRVEANLLGTLLFSGPIAAYAVWRLLLRLRQGRAGSILANGPFLGGAAAVAAAVSGRSVPVFVWVHADIGAGDRRSSRGFLQWLTRRVAGFFVNSEDVEVDLRAAGVPAEAIVRIPNWVDAPPPGPVTAARVALLDRMATHRFVSVYVGRLVAYKHVLTYLDAARKVASPALAIVFIGDGELQPEVVAASVAHPDILYAGPLPNADARAVMAAANVTLSYADTTYVSAAAMESLAGGTPVVYPAVSCAPEKFLRHIPIERELLPAPGGCRVAADPEVVARELVRRAASGSPTAAERARCRDLANAQFSPANAAPLLRALREGSLRAAGARSSP